METSTLQPIPFENVVVFQTPSSTASVSSCKNTIKASNQDMTLRQVSTRPTYHTCMQNVEQRDLTIIYFVQAHSSYLTI
jgi:hypothetical protein